MAHKHHKTKRRQPAPKKKKVRLCGSVSKESSIEKQFKKYGKKLLKILENKDAIKERMALDIAKIEGYFRRYDSIQLLGSIGLYLIDNLPTLEKSFNAQISGSVLRLDEEAEVIAEYALNFGLSMQNNARETPSAEIVEDLRESLRGLLNAYRLLDMPLDNEAEQFLDWIIHAETIAVRGDAYSVHMQEVYEELFEPHSAYYLNNYGFTPNDLLSFLVEIEDRIICKLGSQGMIYGPYKMWERWRKWEERTYGPIDETGFLGEGDFSIGIFGDFFKANPDVRGSEDGMQFLLFPPDDYSNSDRIFWVYPQNAVEQSILSALSVEFGDNASFIAEGNFKGNIMNGHSIYEKPFVKVGERFYCFTPMLPYRNIFLIAEKLMMRDNAYYTANFKNNTSPIGRDNYIESKVKSVLQSFLPDVKFYSSVRYNITEDGIGKKPELDILGVSEKAVYIVEVKAHELSHKDRVGIKGAKDKFKASVTEACVQSQRAAKYVKGAQKPMFNKSGTSISIDKARPVYKIAVTFHHFSTMLGHMDMLIKSGLLEEEHRDTWIVSLFDLMVCSDFFESEEQFLSYLDMHKTIYSNHSSFNDEIDILGQFLNNGLVSKVKSNKPMIIVGGHQEIDQQYWEDLRLQVDPITHDELTNSIF